MSHLNSLARKLTSLVFLALAARGSGQICIGPTSPLNTNAGVDSGADTSVRIATDKQGVWIATWASWDTLGGTIGSDQDILYARSFDNGQTWSAPAPLNSNAKTDSGNDHWPRISTDGAGHWVCIWCSTDSLGGTIGTDWDILVSRSSDNGATWSAPAPLNTDAANDSVGSYPRNDLWPDMATDGNGVWIASWASVISTGASWKLDARVARSTDNGLTWSAPVAVHTNVTGTYDEVYPAVTTDRLGNWVVAWRSRDSLQGTIGGDLDILYSRSTDGGVTWSAAGPLNSNAATDAADDASVDVLADSSGVFVAVWCSFDSLGGTKGTDGDIVFARSTDAGATWSAPQVLTARMNTDTGTDNYPRLGTDGAGNWLVTFESTDTLGGLKGTDSDILCARSQDGGLTWRDETVVNSTASTDSQYDGISYPMTDGQGHWIVAWHSYGSLGASIGGDGDILYAQVSCVESTPTPVATLTPTLSPTDSPTPTPTFTSSPAQTPPPTGTASPSVTPTPCPEDQFIYFTIINSAGGGIGKMELKTGAISSVVANMTAIGLDFDSQGNLYFASDTTTNATSLKPDLWRLSPGGALSKLVRMYNATVSDAGWALSVAVSPNDEVYFTRSAFASNGPGISKMLPGGAVASVYDSAGSVIEAITFAPNGDLYFLTDQRYEQLIRLDASGGLTTLAILWSSTKTSDLWNPNLVVGPDNAVYYSISPMVGGGVGRYDIATGVVTAVAQNYAAESVAVDRHGNLYVGTGGNSETDLLKLGSDGSFRYYGPLYQGSSSWTLWTSDLALEKCPIPRTPTPSPTATQTPIPTATPSPTPTASESQTPSPTATPSLTPQSTASLSPSLTASATATPPPQLCFSADAPLNTDAYADSGVDGNVRITAGAGGLWLAAWASTDSLGGTIGGDRDILIAKSFDAGHTWSAPQALNTNAATDAGEDHWPRISTDGAGNWVAVWCSTDSLGGTIGTDWDILVSRSSDNAETWTPPAPLNADAATDPVAPYAQNDIWPDLATDGNGVWVASWSSVLSLGYTWRIETRIARSLDNGATWSAPVTLHTVSAYDELYTALAADGIGNWVVVWRSPSTLGGKIGSDLDILYSRSSDSGQTWSAPAALNSNAATDSGSDMDPDIATDRNGVWIASWRSYDSLGGTKGTDADIVFARSTDAGLTWSAPQPLTARMRTDTSSDAYPRLAADGAGHWLAVFESTDPLNGTVGSDSDVFYAYSSDGGLTWPEEGVVNSSAYSDTQYDGIAYPATDRNGHWVIGWHSTATLGGTIGGDFDILFAVAPCVAATPTPSPSPTQTPIPSPSPTPTASPTMPPTCPEGPASAALHGFLVEFLGSSYDAGSNTTTFNYRVTGLGSPPALSHWVLGLGSCSVVAASPQPYSIGLDPRTQVYGIKWEQSIQPNESMLYSVTLAGLAQAGTVEAAVKAGPGFEGGPMAGPRCDCASGENPLAQPIPVEIQGAVFSEGGDMGGEWVGGVIDLNPHASLAADSPTTASATVELGGLCMAVPAAGDQIVAWYSSGNPIQLVDGAVYRVTFDATTDQAGQDAIPLLDMFYDNFTGGAGPAYGGSAWFLDVAGGAEGIGRAQGRSSYTVYLAPNAFLTPQWRGLLGGGAFTPEADPYKNMRIGFRILDLGSAGYNAVADSGSICVGNVRVETFNANALPVDATLYDAPISNNTHAPFAFGQAPLFAEIDDSAHVARYRLDTASDRATLLPALDLNPPNRVYDLSSLYPVAWESNTLYRVTASIQLATDASGTSPLDAIYINVDTPTVELGQTSYTVCGTPNYFRFAASPRKAADAGGPQSYVAFFYGQNASLADGAARLRPLVDLFNTPQLNGIGSGGDPLEVLGLKVDRLREP